MSHRKGALAVLTAVSLIGCGGSASRGSLAESLMTEGDLPGKWSLDLGPEDMQLPESGEVSEENLKFLPRTELCDEASQDSKDAVEALKWEAFRQFNMTVDDPIDPPLDREGHIVFVQEFLMSAEPDELSGMFADMSSGFDSCVGEIPAGEEGPGTLTRFTPADVGDEQIGALYTIGEAGGQGTWYVYVVFVRKGSVLMSLSVADVVMGDLEPIIDTDTVADITATAAAKIA